MNDSDTKYNIEEDGTIKMNSSIKKGSDKKGSSKIGVTEPSPTIDVNRFYSNNFKPTTLYRINEIDTKKLLVLNFIIFLFIKFAFYLIGITEFTLDLSFLFVDLMLFLSIYLFLKSFTK